MDKAGLKSGAAQAERHDHPIVPELRSATARGQYTVALALLDPTRVRIWTGNPRIYEDLSPESVRGLIESIESAGQETAVIVREVVDDPRHDYEIIAGARRHFAVSWLRKHRDPDLRLLAQVTNYNDRRAFQAADLENKERKDISDIERARSYKVALDTLYFGHQANMAKDLGYSEGQLSKLLRLLDLPNEIVEVYGGASFVTVANANDVRMAWKSPAKREAMKVQLADIAADQRQRASRGKPVIPGHVVAERLLAAAEGRATTPAKSPTLKKIEVIGDSGGLRLTLTIKKSVAAISFSRPAHASREDWLSALQKVVDVLESSGDVDG